MRYWSSDVFSSGLTLAKIAAAHHAAQPGDVHESPARCELLREHALRAGATGRVARIGIERVERDAQRRHVADQFDAERARAFRRRDAQLRAHLLVGGAVRLKRGDDGDDRQRRSEEHTSELQSLMRISYAVFCLKKK